MQEHKCTIYQKNEGQNEKDNSTVNYEQKKKIKKVFYIIFH